MDNRNAGLKVRTSSVVPTGLNTIGERGPGSELPGYFHSAPDGAQYAALRQNRTKGGPRRPTGLPRDGRNDNRDAGLKARTTSVVPTGLIYDGRRDPAVNCRAIFILRLTAQYAAPTLA